MSHVHEFFRSVKIGFKIIRYLSVTDRSCSNRPLAIGPDIDDDAERHAKPVEEG